MTLMIGTEDERVDDCHRLHCQVLPSSAPRSCPALLPSAWGWRAPMPIEVTVGGATVFVTNVERFEKL